MEENKKILLTFCFWLFLGLIVFVIGITNSYALTYTNVGSMNDGTSMMVEVTYQTESGLPNVTIPFDTTVHTQFKKMLLTVTNYHFIANRQYQLEIHLPNMQITNSNTYSVTNGSSNCRISYDNSIFLNEWPRWNFECPTDSNEIYILVSNTSNTAITEMGSFRWNGAHLRYTDESIPDDNNNAIIENNNQNTQNIIDNQNQNAQDIIDNQNQNNQELKDTINDNFHSCRNSINLLNQERLLEDSDFSHYIYNNENVIKLVPTKTNHILLFDNILSAGTYTYKLNLLGANNSSISIHVLFSDDTNQWVQDITETSKSWISVTKTLTVNKSIKGLMIISYSPYVSNLYYFKELQLEKGSTSTSYEPFGQICTNKIDDTNDKLNDLNNSLNDNNINGATSSAGNFFSNFSTDTFGLTSIITAPLSLINSLINKTCSPLVLPLPYVNSNLTLPCMTTIYSQFFGDFLTLYQTITFGIISYWVCVRIFNLVKDFKNPDHDEIEVLDL